MLSAFQNEKKKNPEPVIRHIAKYTEVSFCTVMYMYMHKIMGNVKAFSESSIHFLLLLETAYKDSSLLIMFYWWKLYIITDININQAKSTLQFF